MTKLKRKEYATRVVDKFRGVHITLENGVPVMEERWHKNIKENKDLTSTKERFSYCTWVKWSKRKKWLETSCGNHAYINKSLLIMRNRDHCPFCGKEVKFNLDSVK